MTRIKAQDKLDSIEVASFVHLKDETRKAIINELKEKLKIGTLDLSALPRGEGQPIPLSSLADLLGGKK